MSAPATDSTAYSPRQNDVLDSALRLLVEGGEKALTTAGLARAANCSKESLYKWFGDRDGLLSAVIEFQARKVRVPAEAEGLLNAAELRQRLEEFARELLAVLASDASLALNRLAIGQASGEGARLGRLLQERGRRGIGRRIEALLEAARDAGLLAFDEAGEAYATLYGLIVTDQHLRWLLGEKPDPASFGPRAEKAVAAFLRLHGIQGFPP
ncbi:TetR family transcriptional regulator [Rhizobium rhizosphaerae]|uniref:TetR family transcriptional regulator n=1 Tax=Xaviernesmea rhizosphaerae TaxID=1672749 RepID=A0ABX3PJM8_9HYPH|nr:TetR/AcrR family transcriptional regulator [Xaviernesmea rhizosphaerae]OQP88417.1 TetR family transcriptional regulator [Xaviernesmea rhizosphaerae]